MEVEKILERLNKLETKIKYQNTEIKNIKKKIKARKEIDWIFNSEMLKIKFLSFYNLTHNQVFNKSRTPQIVKLRVFFMGLLKENGLPLQNIAEQINKKSHANVIHALKRLENKHDLKPEYEQFLKDFEAYEV